MLQELHLRSLGVIAEASVELAPGLNVVTGETGVGKTLLVTSLGLLTGARATARLVADGAAETVVQAVVSLPPALAADLAVGGLASDGEVILARKVSADGRSRALVDAQLVPVATLAEIGSRLVEIHGQGAGFALARPAAQLDAIDALARNDDLLAQYRAALADLRSLERERAELDASEAARAREIDLLTYQAEEIERAALEQDEDEHLHARIARLEHAERLGEIGSEVLGLAGPEGAAGELAQAHRSLESAAAFDPDVVPLTERLGQIAVEATELAREIRTWVESTEADPSQLEGLRERKALIAMLKRKYGATTNDVIAFGADARTKLERLVGADERIGDLDGEIATARDRATDLATALSKRRRKAAKELTKTVSQELPSLALPKAVFRVEHSEAELTETGADRIAFLFSSSSARSAEEIGKIASGGELSRAMIAVTLALAAAHSIPVLVFDEADQGVGGEAALELGRRLARLGRSHQVLVVSHLPQIAAFADRHIVVRRTDDVVDVAVLDDDERLIEISRMLAGLESSDLARAHAAELLTLAEQERSTTVAAAG